MVVDTLYRDAAGEVAPEFSFDKSVLEKFIRRVYEKDFHPMTDMELGMFLAVWDTLDIATDKGFGARGSNDPDYDFYNALRHNNAVFAAFKVHRMQNDIAALLLDSNGNLKPFEQWAKEAMPIADHQVYQWLRTEYDTALIRAHQAADWRQFEREKDILPNLKWMPSTSIHPGADHRLFWGTIRPIDDPFWDEHRPGDRWNCKCSLSSTDEEPTQAPEADPKSKPQAGLENNPGKDGKLFSDKHPYVVNAHPGAKEAVEKFLEEQSHYQKLSVKAGRLRIHEGHGKNEKAENIRIGTYLAEKHGYEIDLLDNPNDVKSADSYNWTLGMEQEYKLTSTPTVNAIDRLIRDGKKQADDLVLWIESDISLGDLRDAIKGRVGRSENIKSILIIRDGKDAMFRREDILKTNWTIKQADFQ